MRRLFDIFKRMKRRPKTKKYGKDWISVYRVSHYELWKVRKDPSYVSLVLMNHEFYDNPTYEIARKQTLRIMKLPIEHLHPQLQGIFTSAIQIRFEFMSDSIR